MSNQRRAGKVFVGAWIDSEKRHAFARRAKAKSCFMSQMIEDMIDRELMIKETRYRWPRQKKLKHSRTSRL